MDKKKNILFGIASVTVTDILRVTATLPLLPFWIVVWILVALGGNCSNIFPHAAGHPRCNPRRRYPRRPAGHRYGNRTAEPERPPPVVKADERTGGEEGGLREVRAHACKRLAEAEMH